MSLDGIISEALHSNQWHCLTNNELRHIMNIVDHAQQDLKKNDGKKRSDEDEDKWDHD